MRHPRHPVPVRTAPEPEARVRRATLNQALRYGRGAEDAGDPARGDAPPQHRRREEYRAHLPCGVGHVEEPGRTCGRTLEPIISNLVMLLLCSSALPAAAVSAPT